MKRFLIDTNALISFVTDRNPVQQNKISLYFEDAVALKHEIIIIENVITEFIYVMQSVYNVDDISIENIIIALTQTPGIILGSNFDVNLILAIWPDKITDYGDAVLASYSLNNNLPIITFDKQLIKELKKLNQYVHGL